SHPTTPPPPDRYSLSLHDALPIYSRYELARKLSPYADDPGDIEPLLNDLEREGWLSNERFAQSLLNRRAPRQGASRILNELRQQDRKSTRLNSSHVKISYAVFCLK